ncbi:MAG: hypothetical protein IT386_17420 [Deltaproteobacteria bacterium]|nr:hypothetical protein [Deltaproteobacteria bacterium]
MLESRIETGARLSSLSPRQVEREFRALLEDGARIRSTGTTKARPGRLLSLGYVPRHRLRLFDTVFYLCGLRQEPNARYFIAYLLPGASSGRASRRCELFPRYFYKDASLVWRSASHFARSDTENWIGKGDLKPVREASGDVTFYSAEETTNLPLEIQTALDLASRMTPHVPRDERAIGLVLRRAPDDRVEPYADFTALRRRAAADRRNLVNGGRRVAWFARRADPESLRFARGYEPDFAQGILEVDRSASRIYGGEIRKFRILSSNRRIQYQFVAAPRHVWIVPPQALTTELTTFGVRTIDVVADDDLSLPGFEYHYVDDSEDPPRLYSQIPEGWAGEICAADPARADASPWLEALPVVRAFRKAIGFPRPREVATGKPGAGRRTSGAARRTRAAKVRGR